MSHGGQSHRPHPHPARLSHTPARMSHTPSSNGRFHPPMRMAANTDPRWQHHHQDQNHHNHNHNQQQPRHNNPISNLPRRHDGHPHHPGRHAPPLQDPPVPPWALAPTHPHPQQQQPPHPQTPVKPARPPPLAVASSRAAVASMASAISKAAAVAAAAAAEASSNLAPAGDAPFAGDPVRHSPSRTAAADLEDGEVAPPPAASASAIVSNSLSISPANSNPNSLAARIAAIRGILAASAAAPSARIAPSASAAAHAHAQANAAQLATLTGVPQPMRGPRAPLAEPARPRDGLPWAVAAPPIYTSIPSVPFSRPAHMPFVTDHPKDPVKDTIISDLLTTNHKGFPSYSSKPTALPRQKSPLIQPSLRHAFQPSSPSTLQQQTSSSSSAIANNSTSTTTTSISIQPIQRSYAIGRVKKASAASTETPLVRETDTKASTIARSDSAPSPAITKSIKVADATVTSENKLDDDIKPVTVPSKQSSIQSRPLPDKPTPSIKQSSPILNTPLSNPSEAAPVIDPRAQTTAKKSASNTSVRSWSSIIGQVLTFPIESPVSVSKIPPSSVQNTSRPRDSVSKAEKKGTNVRDTARSTASPTHASDSKNAHKVRSAPVSPADAATSSVDTTGVSEAKHTPDAILKSNQSDHTISHKNPSIKLKIKTLFSKQTSKSAETSPVEMTPKDENVAMRQSVQQQKQQSSKSVPNTPNQADRADSEVSSKQSKKGQDSVSSNATSLTHNQESARRASSNLTSQNASSHTHKDNVSQIAGRAPVSKDRPRLVRLMRSESQRSKKHQPEHQEVKDDLTASSDIREVSTTALPSSADPATGTKSQDQSPTNQDGKTAVSMAPQKSSHGDNVAVEEVKNDHPHDAQHTVTTVPHVDSNALQEPIADMKLQSNDIEMPQFEREPDPTTPALVKSDNVAQSNTAPSSTEPRAKSSPTKNNTLVLTPRPPVGAIADRESLSPVSNSQSSTTKLKRRLQSDSPSSNFDLSSGRSHDASKRARTDAADAAGFSRVRDNTDRPPRDSQRDRMRGNHSDHGGDVSDHKSMRGRDSSRERVVGARGRDGDRVREYDNGRRSDGDYDRKRDIKSDVGQGRDRDRDIDRERDFDRDRDRKRDFDRNRGRDRDIDRDRDRDIDRDRHRDMDRDRGRSRDLDRDIDRDRDRNYDSDRSRNRDYDRNRDRDYDMGSSQGRSRPPRSSEISRDHKLGSPEGRSSAYDRNRHSYADQGSRLSLSQGDSSLSVDDYLSINRTHRYSDSGSTSMRRSDSRSRSPIASPRRHDSNRSSRDVITTPSKTHNVAASRDRNNVFTASSSTFISSVFDGKVESESNHSSMKNMTSPALARAHNLPVSPMMDSFKNGPSYPSILTKALNPTRGAANEHDVKHEQGGDSDLKSRLPQRLSLKDYKSRSESGPTLSVTNAEPLATTPSKSVTTPSSILAQQYMTGRSPSLSATRANTDNSVVSPIVHMTSIPSSSATPTIHVMTPSFSMSPRLASARAATASRELSIGRIPYTEIPQTPIMREMKTGRHWRDLSVLHKRQGDHFRKLAKPGDTDDIRSLVHYVASGLCYISSIPYIETEVVATERASLFQKSIDSMTSFVQSTMSTINKYGWKPVASLLLRCEACILHRQSLLQQHNVKMILRQIESIKALEVDTASGVSKELCAENLAVKQQALAVAVAASNVTLMQIDNKLREARSVCVDFYSVFHDYFDRGTISIDTPIDIACDIARQCFYGFMIHVCHDTSFTFFIKAVDPGTVPVVSTSTAIIAASSSATTPIAIAAVLSSSSSSSGASASTVTSKRVHHLNQHQPH